MRCLISLGANLGNPRENLQTALSILRDGFPHSWLNVSHLYRTPAVGGPRDQGEFLNAVVAMETPLNVFEAWNQVRHVEHLMGRQRVVRWEARRIDVDILLCDQDRIWTPRLKIPHPRMCTRSFILEPAAEVASEWIEPVSGWSIARLANHCRRHHAVICVVAENESLLSDLRSEFERELERQQVKSAWVKNNIHLPELMVSYQFIPHAGFELGSIDRPFRRRAIQSRLEEVATTQRRDSSQYSDGEIEVGYYLVAAVTSNDPTTIAWEDRARPWAEALQMCASKPEGDDNPLTQSPRTWDGPRYLLAADQLAWSAHELYSMALAIRCPTERQEPILF